MSETRTSSQVASDAAAAAENSALELDNKTAIARRAAEQARVFARIAHQAQLDGNDGLARDYARRALQEAQTAADAAGLIL